MTITITFTIPRWQHCVRCQLACCAHISTQWGRRWFLVQDTFLMYVNADTGKRNTSNIGELLMIHAKTHGLTDRLNAKNENKLNFY